jgi:hypothetical protein
LRENLIEHFDFEVLFPPIWLYLYSWYSADCQIVRYLRKDKLTSGQYRLELYPISHFEKLSRSLIGQRGRSANYMIDDEEEDDDYYSSSDEGKHDKS